MKKIIVFLTLVALSISLFSCSGNKENQITKLVYSNYYQNATDFEEIRPALDQYFNSILSAYEESNKKDLNTFILSDSYRNAKSILSSISSDVDFSSAISGNDDDKKHYLAKLKLLEAYAKIEVALAERDILIAVGSNDNEKWFNDLDETIWKYFDLFRKEITE